MSFRLSGIVSDLYLGIADF